MKVTNIRLDTRQMSVCRIVLTFRWPTVINWLYILFCRSCLFVCSFILREINFTTLNTRFRMLKRRRWMDGGGGRGGGGEEERGVTDMTY